MVGNFFSTFIFLLKNLHGILCLNCTILLLYNIIVYECVGLFDWNVPLNMSSFLIAAVEKHNNTVQRRRWGHLSAGRWMGGWVGRVWEGTHGEVLVNYCLPHRSIHFRRRTRPPASVCVSLSAPPPQPSHTHSPHPEVPGAHKVGVCAQAASISVSAALGEAHVRTRATSRSIRRASMMRGCSGRAKLTQNQGRAGE